MLSGDNGPFLCGEAKMSTDPKKNDEIKDEQLDMVSGGATDGRLEKTDGTDGTGAGSDGGTNVRQQRGIEGV